MKGFVIDLPTFGFVVATRAILGAGLGLLLSSRLSDDRRQRIGMALFAIGAATTVPAAISLRKRIRRSAMAGRSAVGFDRRLIGATRFPRRGDQAI
jgi:hypothetical protein